MASEAYLGSCQNIFNGAFLRKYLTAKICWIFFQESSITDVWQGPRHDLEIFETLKVFGVLIQTEFNVKFDFIRDFNVLGFNPFCPNPRRREKLS